MNNPTNNNTGFFKKDFLYKFLRLNYFNIFAHCCFYHLLPDQLYQSSPPQSIMQLHFFLLQSGPFIIYSQLFVFTSLLPISTFGNILLDFILTGLEKPINSVAFLLLSTSCLFIWKIFPFITQHNFLYLYQSIWIAFLSKNVDFNYPGLSLLCWVLPYIYLVVDLTDCSFMPPILHRVAKSVLGMIFIQAVESKIKLLTLQCFIEIYRNSTQHTLKRILWTEKDSDKFKQNN